MVVHAASTLAFTLLASCSLRGHVEGTVIIPPLNQSKAFDGSSGSFQIADAQDFQLRGGFLNDSPMPLGMAIPLSIGYAKHGDARTLRRALQGSANGNEVSLTPSLQSLIMYGAFSFKDQEAPLIIDTGSSDVWVATSSGSVKKKFNEIGRACCSSGSCCANNSCKEQVGSQTGSGRTATTCETSIKYISASVDVQIGVTDLSFGSDSFSNYQGGAGVVSDSITGSTSDINGIAGFAFPLISKFTSPPLAGYYQDFTFVLNPDITSETGNSLLVGKAANIKLPSGLKWQGIKLAPYPSNMQAFWTVENSALTVGETSITLPNVLTILDTGSSTAYLPSDLFQRLFKIVTANAKGRCRPSSCSSGTALQLIGCTSLEGLENITLDLGSKMSGGVQLTVTPEEYMQQGFCTDTEYTMIFFGGNQDTSSDPNKESWILGLTFIRLFKYIKHSVADRAVYIAVPTDNSSSSNVRALPGSSSGNTTTTTTAPVSSGDTPTGSSDQSGSAPDSGTSASPTTGTSSSAATVVGTSLIAPIIVLVIALIAMQ